MPGGPAWAQDADTIEYAENGTGSVATYTAVDPEDAEVKWSLSGADAADFTIAGGVLAFVKSPDFEKPADADEDNIYDVVVEATDGTGHVGRKAVTVEVTNVDEAGTVKLSALQPAPDVMFTATLTDIDNLSTDLTGSAEWQWSRSQSATGGWEDIDKATSSMYEPDEDGEDSGYYLRATAKYEDRQSPSGADNDKTASMVSANKVLVLRTSNEVPEFDAVQDPDGATDEAKAIAKRTVTETAAAGQLVGDPVTAEDDDADDVLTYTLVAADDGADDNFVIDRATGQISVAKGAKFNREDDDPIAGVRAANSYMVTVIATDPKGIPTEDATDEDNEGFRDTVMVMISVDPVDEPPIFTVASDSAVVFTNVGKFAAVSFDEVNGIDDTLTNAEGGEIGIALATFTANDPETPTGVDDPTTRGIRGADSSKFTFDATTGVLTFKAAPAAAPDFEKPADADKDNVYEVTITAADGNANMSTRDVKITVTNAEELGEVTLSQPRPRTGLAITASYSDSDGGLASATWQWWRTVSTSPTEARPVLIQTDVEGLVADTANWLMIEDATSATYTPVLDNGDDDAELKSDVGRYLLAVVSYTDAKQNVDEMPKDIAGGVSAYAVGLDTRNRAPVFKDQDSDTPGRQNQTATREVAENTKASVGNPVTAKDPDPNADPLIYTLSGADAALFSVDSDGQITVKSGTKLDYEAAKNVYMVTLTAADSFSDSASIDVTITVTDADEAPDVTGDATKEYAEKGTGSVATYTAEDPEGAAIKWSLSGADASDFSIEGGVLAFVKSPNFEKPTDKVGTDTGTPTAVATDNIYEIMVEATDGTGHVGRKAVKVEVTNVDEDGTVKLSALQPAPNVAFTATLTDIDNPSTDLTDSAEWQWSRSKSKSGWADIDKATKSAYTPDKDDKDKGYYLRATAKYTDGQSPSGADNDKTASMVSANKVLALRTSNEVPEFDAVQDPDGASDEAKAIAKRTVTETAAAGQLVGDPVTAEDGDAADVLTYTLVAADDGADDNFVIDRATGQISVAEGAKFSVVTDDDVDVGGQAINADSYTVTVVATDPKGVPTDDATAAGNDMLYSDTVMVMITVTPVDEPPIFTVASDSAVVFTNVGKFTAVSFDEVNGIDGTLTNAEGGEIGIALATFTANDPETPTGGEDPTTLGIRGADSSKFAINAEGMLTFKAVPGFAAPDFEKPADADKNNVYEVTITAADGNANMSTRDVKVTVTNAEELGEVTLSQSRPRVGLAITAGYSDLDGGLASATWQWWRTADFSASDTVPTLPDLQTPGGDWEMIAGATSASYKPVLDNGDDDAALKSDVGRYLLAVVSYTDAKQNVDAMPKDMAGLVSVNPVAEDTRNRAPVFEDQDSDTPGTQNQSAMREVAENTKGAVGSAVTAKDPDPNVDPLVYELSGADAALFSVDSDGQITVKSGTKLDYEAAKNVYMVTLTATDSFSDSASIDVTIMVTDVDEGPEIMRAPDANVAPEFASTTITRTVLENTAAGENIGNPVEATDDNNDTLTYALNGTDAASFDIDPATGQLMTKAALDFETEATYSVTVTASDSGGLSDSIDVMVMVTNVDEMGRVTFWRGGADATTAAIMVGDELGGAVDDSDGNPGDTFPIAMYTRIANVTSWQWARSMDMTDWEDIGTDGMYTVIDDDAGHYLRATATYTDGEGIGKMASKETKMVGAVTDVDEADRTRDTIRLEIEQAILDAVLSAGIDDAERSAIEQLILEFALTPSS